MRKVTERRRPSPDLGKGQRAQKPCAREQTVLRKEKLPKTRGRGRGRGESEGGEVQGSRAGGGGGREDADKRGRRLAAQLF